MRLMPCDILIESIKTAIGRMSAAVGRKSVRLVRSKASPKGKPKMKPYPLPRMRWNRLWISTLKTSVPFLFHRKQSVGSTSSNFRPACRRRCCSMKLIAQNVRPAELARRLHTTPQEVNRLTNVLHTTRIDGIATALQALGKHLDMRVVEA